MATLVKQGHDKMGTKKAKKAKNKDIRAFYDPHKWTKG